jgi:hypothetical protein
MRIVGCCEGPSDKGPLESFFKQIAAYNESDVCIETRRSIKVRTRTFNAKWDDDKRFSRKAQLKRLNALAVIEEADHAVYFQDCDKLDYETVYYDVSSDMASILPKNIKHIPIIAKPMIEVWLMADAKAYPVIPTNPQLPRPLEDGWFDEKIRSPAHPKCYFKKTWLQFDQGKAHRGIYKQIAERSSIQVILKLCPVSFGRFYTDMQSFVLGMA